MYVPYQEKCSVKVQVDHSGGKIRQRVNEIPRGIERKKIRQGINQILFTLQGVNDYLPTNK
jgi:hypothetical protein